MKTSFLKKALTTYLLIFSGMIVFAQDEQATNSSSESEEIQCEIELSNMTEFMKINLPEFAYQAWQKLFEHCPDASKNIYISGAKIYKTKLRREKNVERRQELFDTLMLIYDRRIEYFGESGSVYGRKGMDIIKYNDKEYAMAYDAFKKSADEEGVKSHLNVVTGYVQTAAVMLKSDKISAAQFLDDYLKSLNILESKEAAGENPAKLKQVEKMLDNILANTKINDCETIESALSERVNVAEPDPDFLKISIDLMTVSGCEDTEFFSDVNEKLMEIAPDPDLAYKVAKFNIKNNNYEKAAEYLVKAIENEEEDESKALYEYQLAVINLSELNNPAEAKNRAMSAANHKENWGEPYFVAASSILEGVRKCSSLEDFDRQAAYWLAVDYCRKAKRVDPTVEKQANDLISQYRSNFPSVEETFFRSLKEGDSYVIGCWINESTTVKVK